MNPAPHRESHVDLLPAFDTHGVRLVDAVVVPSGRGASHLRAAAELTAELGATLVALCSADSKADEVADVVADLPTLRWHAVSVPPGHAHPLLPHRPLVPDRGGRASLSRKRNIGLLIARMLRWETVLLLDDDIRGLDADRILLSAGGLGPASAVGMAVANWPDNSVVCHANRLGGGDQSVFVGGSALLVDATAEDLGHFPVVYNEDWLHLYDAMAAGRVRREGRVTQLPYDPFRDPRRAAAEEFGEIIAEGLVAHLEEGGGAVPLDPGFWAGFLARRAEFVLRTTHRVAAGPPSPRRRAALRSLAAAAARGAEIRPLHCARFLRDWRADRDAWLDRLASIPPVDDVTAAVAALGLQTVELKAVPTRLRPPLATTVHRGGAGVAVVVPGFLDGKDSPAHRSLCAALHAGGLTAVSFDPRGTGASPGTPADTGPTTRLADLRALLDEHAGTAGRVVLVGHSYGAWLCGLLAAGDERITEVVAIMPTRQFIWSRDHDPALSKSWRRHGERIFSAPDPGTVELRSVRVPHSVVEDARRYDLPRGLAELRQPILFLAGENDTVVRPSDVALLHDGCGSRARVLTTLPGVCHDYRDDPAQRAAVETAVLGWLARDREVLTV